MNHHPPGPPLGGSLVGRAVVARCDVQRAPAVVALAIGIHAELEQQLDDPEPTSAGGGHQRLAVREVLGVAVDERVVAGELTGRVRGTGAAAET